MLLELRVRNLGVIEDAHLVLGEGLTALTGETGAGKTLIVDALGLLVGGRADATVVRPGADEAVVEGRFEGPDGVDVVLCRVVAAGRSRAYVDGRMASAATLDELGRSLLDLHGQHAAQSLLSPAAQRDALDRAGAVDRRPLGDARRRLRELDDALAALGGDERARARELDLLRYQLADLDGAGLEDPEEDDRLREEEDRLADAGAAREALAAVHEALAGEDGARDRLGVSATLLAGRAALGGLQQRLRALAAEVADAADEARATAEAAEEDPARLAALQERRRLLRELRRKYGDSLGEVIAYREEARRRLDELESRDVRAAELDRLRAAAASEVAREEEALAVARRRAAGPFADAVATRLRELALPRARFSVQVDGPAGEQVTWMLAANPGQPLLPLARVASGGELSRTMLAARLVVSGVAGAERPAPGDARALVFDEVDAGIGGEAAVAVGRALADLGRHHQVLVVTHLPQVAAVADHHLAVAKEVAGDTTVARVRPVEGTDRLAELSRLLSGQPDSATARRHAEELLAGSARPRRPGRPRSAGKAPAAG